eukprot:5597018-Prymnesium_polylepis.2
MASPSITYSGPSAWSFSSKVMGLPPPNQMHVAHSILRLFAAAVFSSAPLGSRSTSSCDDAKPKSAFCRRPRMKFQDQPPPNGT